MAKQTAARDRPPFSPEVLEEVLTITCHGVAEEELWPWRKKGTGRISKKSWGNIWWKRWHGFYEFELKSMKTQMGKSRAVNSATCLLASMSDFEQSKMRY